eukprot:5529092-Pleurochrysis_carterae.AAC.1
MVHEYFTWMRSARTWDSRMALACDAAALHSMAACRTLRRVAGSADDHAARQDGRALVGEGQADLVRNLPCLNSCKLRAA